ncbi:MAG: methyltransferase [Bacteroidia bacterium]|nr:methyltransferase [Bacteroidia bacterium]
MESTVKKRDPFYFKSFTVEQEGATMKVGTDGVLLGAWANVTKVKRVLDIGTGTGVIALMIAQRQPKASVIGVEIDPNAYEVAVKNFQSSNWSSRLKVINQSIQDFSQNESTFDLIVCNPPFFTGGTLSNNADRAEVRHTIKLPHNDLLRSIRKLLSSEGRFCVVLPLLEGLRFKEMAESAGLYCSKLTEVKGHVDKNVERVLLEFTKRPSITKVDTLAINQSNTRHDYTDAYRTLVEDFYTIL